MLSPTDLLDETDLNSIIAELKPMLEEGDYEFFEGSWAKELCIKHKKQTQGPVLVEKRTSHRLCPARPIEALCLIGYRTLHPARQISNLFYEDTKGNLEYIALREQLLKINLLVRLEIAAAQTREFERRIAKYCERALEGVLTSEILSLEQQTKLSNYQISALRAYLGEIRLALTQKGEDSLGGNCFPFRELKTQYIKGEPRHMRPALLGVDRALQERLLEKAQAEHRNIFQSELSVEPSGYDSDYANR